MGYPTPNTLPAVVICRQLSIPHDPIFMAAVNGALLDLCEAERWEQYGAVSPEAAAAAAQAMFNRYVEGTACMVGSIVAYATKTLPDGVLACDGATYQRVDYPLLYELLDDAYLVDADHFVVPDLRGRTMVGVGAGAGLTPRNVNDFGGEERHQLTTAELPAHNHSLNGVTLTMRNGIADTYNFFVEAAGIPGISTNASGADQPHENMPPFVALRYGIVAR